MNRRRLYERIRAKRGKNVHFEEVCHLLELHDWELHRIAKSNHYLYVHSDYEGTVNIPKPHHSDVLPTYVRNAIKAIEEVEGYSDE